MRERPRRHPLTAYKEIGDEGGLVVLSGRAEVKVLNPVGSTVYGLLAGEHTIDEIVDAVVAEFEVPAEQARRDVNDFIAELADHGMLDPAPVPAGGKEIGG